MKKIIISFTLAIISTLAFAGESNNMKLANDAYKAEKYALADSLYTQVMKNEGESAALFYNLGNAKYKQGEIAYAILYYEKSLKLEPDNEDTKFNLEMARSQTVDKIETMEKFVLTEWNESIQKGTTSNGWAKWSIFSFIVALVLIGLYIFSPKVLIKKIAFFTALAALIFTFISFGYAKAQNKAKAQNESAIIVSPTVTGKSAPDDGGTDLFVLHEGTKVNVKSKLGDWMEIQMEDGNTGWIKSNKVEII